MALVFVKNKLSDKIWWVKDPPEIGEHLFTFDKKHVFNLFRDYPHRLTAAQVSVFDRENPFWADFFKDRKKK